MAPGTHGTGTRTSPVHLSPKPLPPVRDNQQGVLQWTRESTQTRGHRPAFLTAVLVISTRVTHQPLTRRAASILRYNAYPQNYSSFSTYLSYLSLEGRGHR